MKYIILLLFFCVAPIFCKTIVAKVVAVLDGDTFILLDSLQVQHRIRLSGVDAPEKNQAFGQKAKIALSNLIYGQYVNVEYFKLDKYERILGLAKINDTIVNEAMIQMGFAWAYLKYLDVTNRHYQNLEFDARNAKKGLWIDNEAIAPWEFRHN